MYQKVVEETPCLLRCIPDRFKTEMMCNEVVRRVPRSLVYVPDCFKTLEMCKKVVGAGGLLKDVPDWLVKREWIDMQRNEYYDDDNDKHSWHDKYNFFEWCDDYKKQKVQKASIKEELMPIAWHPSRWWDWCIPEDEKKRQKKIF